MIVTPCVPGTTAASSRPDRPTCPPIRRERAPHGWGLVLAVALALAPPVASGAAPSPRGVNPPPPEPARFTGTPGSYGGRLVVSALGPPKTFNIMIGTDTQTNDILNNNVMEGLLRYDNQLMVYQPGLCSKWEMSKDGRTWTFTLRQGLRWSDGAPLTIEDVLFTTKVLFDEKIHPPSADLLMVDGKPPVFAKVDARTFKVSLPSPYGPFLDAVTSFRILPRHRLESKWKEGKFSSSWGLDTPPDSLVSSGAFRVAAYTPNESLVLKPNPWYYKLDKKGQRLPYVDELVWVFVPDQNADLLRFKSGDVDAANVRAEDLKTMKAGEAAGGYTVFDLGPEFGANYFWFNLNTSQDAQGKPYLDPIKRSWFTNPRFRRALNFAIDRPSIARNVYYGQAEPLYGPIPAVNKTWYDPSTPKADYNLGKARKLLAEAGFKDRNGDGIVEDAAGNKVAFTILTNSSNNERKATAAMIAEDFHAVGLDATSSAIDFQALVQKVTETFDYDAGLLGGTGGVPPDPVTMMNSLRSDGRQHFWWPRQKTPATPWEARIDSLLDAQMKLPTVEQRKPLIDEVQKIYAREMPALFTVNPKRFVAIRSRIRNVRPSIFRPWAVWNADELYLAPGAAGKAGTPPAGGR